MYFNENYDKVVDKSKKGKMYSWIGLVGGFWFYVILLLKNKLYGVIINLYKLCGKKVFFF